MKSSVCLAPKSVFKLPSFLAACLLAGVPLMQYSCLFFHFNWDVSFPIRYIMPNDHMFVSLVICYLRVKSKRYDRYIWKSICCTRRTHRILRKWRLLERLWCKSNYRYRIEWPEVYKKYSKRLCGVTLNSCPVRKTAHEGYQVGEAVDFLSPLWRLGSLLV